MINLTDEFRYPHRPVAGLLIYQQQAKKEVSYYVESFDVDADGRPCNLHPLTAEESTKLARQLEAADRNITERRQFLVPTGLMPDTVLYVSAVDERVVWYTKAGQRPLFFVSSLTIPNGTAYVPALLWVATRTTLRIFAMTSNRRPTTKTKLYRAPFLNVYDNGGLCLGTVKVTVPETASLEAFMMTWEQAFFNSYFSHANYAPTTVNVVTLWQELITTGNRFPTDVLLPTPTKLTTLLR